MGSSFPFIVLITELRCEFQEFNTFQTLVNKLAHDFNLNGNVNLRGNKPESVAVSIIYKAILLTTRTNFSDFIKR